MSEHVGRTGVAVAAVLVLMVSGGVQAAERLVETGRLEGVRAQWLTLEGDRLVFGAGSRIEAALAAPRPEPRGPIEGAGPVSTGVAAGNLLFLGGPGGRIERRWLDRPAERGRAVTLDPAPDAEILLGRTGDYLVVVERDRVLRLFEIMIHAQHGAEHHEVGDLLPAGTLPLRGRSIDVASSGATLYVALEGGRVAILDTSDPLRPTLTGEVDAGVEIRALAASGTKLFVLGAESLRLLDVAGGAARLVNETPLAGGRALEVAGRAIYVATDDGILALRDTSADEAIFNVTVGNNFFNPQLLTIDPGDTVTWNKPVTAVSHNVEACDGVSDPALCSGVVATEPFRSGNAVTTAFTFSVTFDLPGQNPYFCVIHGAGGMTGRVTVRDLAPTNPPGVPAGPPGIPMTVGKNDVAGHSLTLSYDVGSCTGALDHHIVVGGGTTFPAALGGTLGLHGASCDIGKTSPFVWNPSPPTTIDSEGLVWWLIVADDDATTEGAWGKNGAGNERLGPGAGGSSGQCGITAKSLTNTCGQ